MDVRAATCDQVIAAGLAIPPNLRCAERGQLRCYTVPVVGRFSYYRLRIIEHETELVLTPLAADINLPLVGAVVFRRSRDEVDTVGGVIEKWRRLNQRNATDRPGFDQLAWMLALAVAPRDLADLLLINLDAHTAAIDAHYKETGAAFASSLFAMELNELVERAMRSVGATTATSPAVRERLTLTPLAQRLVYEFGNFVKKVIVAERERRVVSERDEAGITGTVDLPVEVLARVVVAMPRPIDFIPTSQTLARYVKLALHQQFGDIVSAGYARVAQWRGRTNLGTDALASTFTSHYTLDRALSNSAATALRFFARTRLHPSLPGTHVEKLPDGVDTLCAAALQAIRDGSLEPTRPITVWQVAIMEMTLLYAENALPATPTVLFDTPTAGALAPPSPASALRRFRTLCSLWGAHDRVAVVYWLACFYEQWVIYYDARQKVVLLELLHLYTEHVYRLATGDERPLDATTLEQLAEFMSPFWMTGNLIWKLGASTATRVTGDRTNVSTYVQRRRRAVAPDNVALLELLDRLEELSD